MRSPPFHRPLLAALSCCGMLGVTSAAFGQTEPSTQNTITPLVYPETRRGDVLDDYHGTQVADPYRWLEDLDGEETAAWVQAQNSVAEPFLESIPAREELAEKGPTGESQQA